MANRSREAYLIVLTIPSRHFSENHRLWLLAITLTVTAAVKLFLATRLELYSDEIFYWQASTRPALAYSDLPFMASLLAGLGSMLGGHSPLAVRSLFLALGVLLPILVYWLARPLTDHRQALESALLTFCLPLAAFLGLLAVPDVPLVVLGLLMMGLCERAIRKDSTGLWVAVGCVTALGLSTHYRFILFPAALAAFLLMSPAHRYLWKTPRLWIGAGIAFIGLIPALLFNLQHDLSGLDYHFVDRHPWAFQSRGLMHPVEQMVAVSPLLYVFLLWVLFVMFRKARKGHHASALLLCFSMAHIGTFMLLAPWADTTRTTLHWPLSGYLPLLIFAPRLLRDLRNSLAVKLNSRTAGACVLVIPLTGLAGSMLTFVGIGSQGFNEQLQSVVGPGVLSNKMAGWRPMTDHLENLMHELRLPDDTLIVTDNYYTAAQIAFYTKRQFSVYTIDRDKAVRDGRLVQYAIWQLDEDGVRQHAGSNALFITEDSTLNVDEKTEVITRACTLFRSLEYIEQLSLFNDDKMFSFYIGRHVLADPEEQAVDAACPLPARFWLEQPDDGDHVSGSVPVTGWAYNEGQGISAIYLLVNRVRHVRLERHTDRPDVVEIRKVSRDPARPVLGFDYRLDTTTLPDGNLNLSLEVITSHGERQFSRQRRIRINNSVAQ